MHIHPLINVLILFKTGVVLSKKITDGTSTSTILDELQPYTQYLTWMAAYTNVGMGPSSIKVSATTSQGGKIYVH